MSYYQFNRQEILQKAKERYSKEKPADYYLENKEAIKEKSKNQYKNLSKEGKNKILQGNSNWFSKKEALKNKWLLFLISIRMS